MCLGISGNELYNSAQMSFDDIRAATAAMISVGQHRQGPLAMHRFRSAATVKTIPESEEVLLMLQKQLQLVTMEARPLLNGLPILPMERAGGPSVPPPVNMERSPVCRVKSTLSRSMVASPGLNMRLVTANFAKQERHLQTS
ncbi:hypothetical protein AK812_SmicGene7215 [Symbiodinium microadriaticum]|uniref:Uncharacterized protein n=1 Tax=Symbiodinium microadriaticum TaxID=2951 RepID=A0A1Q9EP35_SYMMI|nr:hypothetical protein AK812_SmicGene7215 [Symbiodinium microadriaticum]